MTLRTCAHPGCPELVERGRCPAHTQPRRTGPRQRLVFDDAEWQKISRRYRRLHPWCECRDPACRCGGACTQPSQVVDHIVPRRFFLTAEAANRDDNLQALDVRCHNSKTARLDRPRMK